MLFSALDVDIRPGYGLGIFKLGQSFLCLVIRISSLYRRLTVVGTRSLKNSQAYIPPSRCPV